MWAGFTSAQRILSSEWSPWWRSLTDTTCPDPCHPGRSVWRWTQRGWCTLHPHTWRLSDSDRRHHHSLCDRRSTGRETHQRLHWEKQQPTTFVIIWKPEPLSRQHTSTLSVPVWPVPMSYLTQCSTGKGSDMQGRNTMSQISVHLL